MILTLPVLLYQLAFVLIMYIAVRLGRTVAAVALTVCLLWTATHIFFPPLMILQAIVIVGSYLVFWRIRNKRTPVTAPRGETY